MPKVLGCPETSAELRALVCQQASTSVPLSQISLFLNRPLRTIQSIVKRGAERGHHMNAPRTGRHPILDERALRRLHRCVTQDRRQTLQDITDSINTAIPAPVCSRTISTALKTRLGISNRIAAKKPFVNAKQRAKRLAWAKDHLRWTMVDWERVIWTDEASVEIGKESRKCTV